MQPIHERISRTKLKSELTYESFVRRTNFGKNEIYDFLGDEAPALMKEVGRLREVAFREAGGGTGLPLDIDDFDNGTNAYRQLIVWNPEEEEIVGGYRYKKLSEIKPDENGHYHLATSHMFDFSDRFLNEYFPKTIELGRSFVQPQYQPTKDSRKGIFSLDNLWDGLGALIILNSDVRYFFGKMTMYLKFDQLARDMIMRFLMKYYPDPDKLVYPFHEKALTTPVEELDKELCGKDIEENKKILNKFVRSRGEVFPPLINAYMNLSPTMRTFGSSYNESFGDVEEIAILVNINDIYESKKHRHLTSYHNDAKK